MLQGLDLEVPETARALELAGVTHDSRRVRPGDLFVAMVGAHADGRRYAAQAVERGAAAVMGEGPAPHDLAVPWLEAAAPRPLLGEIAARVHGHPDARLLMAGVTGTNGKSTVVALLASILEAAGSPCGRLGTLGYRFRDLEIPGEHTTPEAPDLFAALAAFADAGARAAALEVSSHALELARVTAARFDLAVFTNLTRDHLDFHHDVESYFVAKRRLFDLLKEGGRSVVHVADPWGERLAAELPNVLTCGPEASVSVARAELGIEGTRGQLATPRGRLAFRARLLGRYNLDNILCAAAAGEALGLPQEAIAAGIASCAPLPGRLEPVTAGQAFPVLIDYAHTEAALEAALTSVRELAPDRRVIVVFGCGGDRDAGKRQPMGRIAGELAVLPIVTSDNPRSEDPLRIIADVEAGLQASGNQGYRVVPDRREAIRRAIAVADETSVVLIAGKGHETYQIVGAERLPFSDRQEALAALGERRG
ncbi:MAG: UDP-N-acetylmuramoyl-L-alanyl-D-glutamate--2,6-diaminopimelate ligase [Thermoanaerobaculia bacterium]